MAVRQYIGARYVPKFYEGSNGSEWDANVQYEALTIVTYLNNTYTSKRFVPASVGSPMSNPDYWVATGMYNAQLNAVVQRVDALEGTVGDEDSGLVKDVNDLEEVVGDADNGLIKDVGDLGNSVTVINGEINEIERVIGELTTSGLYTTPESFGAVGNGVADDTEPLQQAIETGKPMLMTGIYRITEGLTFSNDVLSYGGCIYKDFDGVYAILTTHNIKGLEVKSNSDHLTELGIYINNTSNNPIIDNCYVHDLYNNDVGNIDHSVIGIMVTSTSGDNVVTVKNCKVKNIVGNYTSWQSVYSACGILISTPSQTLIDNNYIENVIDSYNGGGISVIPRSNSNSVYSITNNKIKGCGVDCIKVNAPYSLVDHNIVDLDGVNGSTGFTGTYGIRVINSYTTISNNVIFSTNNSNSSQGIFAQWTDTSITREGCKFIGNVVTNTLLGLYINIFSNCFVEDNKFSSNVASHKSLVLLGTGHTIKNNKGVSYLECGNGSVIDGNEITGEISWTYIRNLVVVRNTFTDTAIICSTDNRFDSNLFYNTYLNCSSRAQITSNRFANDSSHNSTPIAFSTNGLVANNILKLSSNTVAINNGGDYCTIVGNVIDGSSTPISCPSANNAIVANVATGGTSSIATGNKVGNNVGIS